MASRSSAARECYRLVNAVQQGQQVSIDLSEVLSVSESYADELFGILAARPVESFSGLQDFPPKGGAPVRLRTPTA
jgi:hypothetical protein